MSEADFAGLALDVREHDPQIALVGGPDGLGPYRAITVAARGTLKPGGWLGVEFGAGQAGAVTGLMAEGGFGDIEVYCDLAGHERVAFGRTLGQTREFRPLPPGIPHEIGLPISAKALASIVRASRRFRY